MPELVIPAPGGRIEARIAGPSGEHAPLALILHPHPKLNGSMQDPLTITLYEMFFRRGFSVLRFNFRPPQTRHGQTDLVTQALSDATFVLDYMHVRNQAPRFCWVAGVSFGAWICLQLLMRRPEIDGFIAVAPPANHYDLSFLAPCPASGLILCGDKDQVAPREAVDEALTKVRVQTGETIDTITVPGANHFFNRKLDALEKTAGDYIDKRLSTPNLSQKTDLKMAMAEID